MRVPRQLASRTTGLLAATIAVLALLGACDATSGSSSPTSPGANLRTQAGWVHEPGGSIHRAAVVDCAPGHEKPLCEEKATEHRCRVDADCSAGPRGQCVMAHLYSEPRYGGTCFCSYTCVTDADCGPGRACICEGRPYGQCAEAACLTDADCGGRECALSVIRRADADALDLACRTSDDECRSDADCHDRSASRCVYKRSQKRWLCDSGTRLF